MKSLPKLKTDEKKLLLELVTIGVKLKYNNVVVTGEKNYTLKKLNEVRDSVKLYNKLYDILDISD